MHLLTNTDFACKYTFLEASERCFGDEYRCNLQTKKLISTQFKVTIRFNCDKVRPRHIRYTKSVPKLTKAFFESILSTNPLLIRLAHRCGPHVVKINKLKNYRIRKTRFAE